MMLTMLALDGLLIGAPGQMMLIMLALGPAAYWRAWANNAHDACPGGLLIGGPGQMMLMMLALDGLLIGGPWQTMLMMLALDWLLIGGPGQMKLMLLALDGLLIGGPVQMMLMMLALGLAAYWRAWANDAHDACPWTGCLLEGLGK